MIAKPARRFEKWRLAVVASHPIQYQAPLFRELATRLDLHVFFAHRATPAQQADAGFGVPFDWDVDLTSGYEHTFLRNVARSPGTSRFSGCDTPGLRAIFGTGSFDAVLVMGWHLKSFLQALWAAKAIRLPVMVRGDSQLATPRGRLKKLVKTIAYPPFLRLFDAALYVGQRSKAYYEHYRYPSKRLFFSPHGVDNDWFAARATPGARERLRARLGIAPASRVVLFAGKLVPFKRPLDVVAACASLSGRGMPVELMVAGSGELEDTIRERAKSVGVRARMLGFQNQTEMPAAYAAADLLVLPSNAAETWGLVANEALACGRPVVVSDACGCAPDLASDGAAGRVFATGAIDALASAIIDVMNNPPTPQSISDRAAHYSIARAVGGIVEAARVIARKRSE
jgi:glycosyltransferase involved in cell wall biosynthesis